MPDLANVYYDPYDQAIDRDPYAVFKRMRDDAPLYRNDVHDFWALSRFDDVMAATLDWRTYSSARGTVLEVIKAGYRMPGNFLFEDPPVHDAHRHLAAGIFSPRRIAAMEPQIRAACAALLDAHVGRGGFDFAADLGAWLPMRVMGELLGIPSELQERLRDRVAAGMRQHEGDERPKDVDVRSVVADCVRSRLEHPAADIITDLSRATLDDEAGVTRTLSEQELVNYVALIAAAGTETTTKLIGWAGYLLARHPDQRRLLADDPSRVPGAIEELLRFESPSPVQARVVARDVELHGETVPAGSAMLLLTAAANHDERAFEDPERFDVTRAIDRHLAFGHGIHFCLGNALARLEGRVALEESSSDSRRGRWTSRTSCAFTQARYEAGTPCRCSPDRAAAAYQGQVAQPGAGPLARASE